MKHLVWPGCAMIAFLLVGLPATEVRGEESRDPDAASIIRVQGEAVVTVEPDMAELLIGVESEGPNAQVAAKNNAGRLDTVLKALHDLLGQDADIKTVGYSVRPVHVKGSITHYSAENSVRVRTADLNRVGEIIDRANEAGANKTWSLRFFLKDDSDVRRMALADAAREVRAKAETLATALGVKIQRILQVDEIGPSRRATRGDFAMAPASGPSTPIEPGDLEIRAFVMLTVEIIE
jgi:uncharacterized protein